MVHYNTLYQSLKKVFGEWHAGHVEWGYSWFYLKFYEDGIVIKTYLNGGDVKKINSWFGRNAEGISKGEYLIKDGYRVIITFEDGTVVEGALVEQDMILLQGKISWEAYKLKQ